MASPENVQTDITPYYKEVWDRGLLGAGVTVAVPDTGAGDAARQFAANLAKQGFSDIPFGQLETVAVPGAPTDPGDNGAHACEVIRRVLMVAPAARIVDLPIFRGTPSRDVIVRAMDVANAHDADVLNMSLGEKVPLDQIETHYDECPVGRHAESLVTDRDIVIVSAKGNFGTERAIACPGLAPGVISVGAHLSPEESAWSTSIRKRRRTTFSKGGPARHTHRRCRAGRSRCFGRRFPESLRPPGTTSCSRRRPARRRR
jgi:subtilisin family serine protease